MVSGERRKRPPPRREGEVALIILSTTDGIGGCGRGPGFPARDSRVRVACEEMEGDTETI